MNLIHLTLACGEKDLCSQNQYASKIPLDVSTIVNDKVADFFFKSIALCSDSLSFSYVIFILLLRPSSEFLISGII